MDEHSTKLYLSVVTVAEIEDGIAKARRSFLVGREECLNG
jgi:predicted nucleic acid-binding protein